MDLSQEGLLKHMSEITSRMSQLDAASAASGSPSVASAAPTSVSTGGETPATTTAGSGPSNADISKMANQLTSNPELMTSLVDKIPDVISPEMMEQAKKLIGSGQAGKLISQMQQNGIDPQAMRSQIAQKQSKAKGMVKHDETTQSVIIVNLTKQIKIREFQKEKMIESAAANLKIKPDDVKDLSCRVMAQGVLDGKKVKCFYNPDDKTSNKRAKKLLGFPVGGDVIFYIENENLSVEDFENAEKFILAKSD